MTNPATTQKTNLKPTSFEAEKRVVGSLLLSPNSITEVSLNLPVEEFYYRPYKVIYETICKLYLEGKPIAPSTVAASLNERIVAGGETLLNEIGGASVVSGTLESVDTDQLDFWIESLHKHYEQRKLLEFAEEARRVATSHPENVSKARTALEEKLISLSGTKGTNSVSISTATGEMEDLIERYIEDPDGIVGLATGWRLFDRVLDGLKPGNVSIVYAPSSRFKSLWVANVGWRLAQQGYPGLWFTTEMPRVQVMERLLQLESGLNLRWLRRDKGIFPHKRDIKSALNRLGDYPIYFCDTSSLDVTEVRAEVSRHKRWNDIKYIIVDLVDHIYSSRFRDEMVNNQRVVMASMKSIAKDFNIHVLLVSHISKGDRQMRNAADLDMEEMTGSAAKYQDVDASISIQPVKRDMSGQWVGLLRPEIIEKVSAKPKDGGGVLDVLISITKNRHGELLRYIMELDFHKGGRFTPSNETNWIQTRLDDEEEE